MKYLLIVLKILFIICSLGSFVIAIVNIFTPTIEMGFSAACGWFCAIIWFCMAQLKDS